MQEVDTPYNETQDQLDSYRAQQNHNNIRNQFNSFKNAHNNNSKSTTGGSRTPSTVVENYQRGGNKTQIGCGIKSMQDKNRSKRHTTGFSAEHEVQAINKQVKKQIESFQNFKNPSQNLNDTDEEFRNIENQIASQANSNISRSGRVSRQQSSRSAANGKISARSDKNGQVNRV